MKLRLVLLATMALGLVLTAALPASASVIGPWYWKESYAAYLIGAPNLTLYDPVQQQAYGRDLLLDSAGLPAYHYLIEFNEDPSKCVAAADDGYLVDVKPCSGSTGVVWIVYNGPDGFSIQFDNVHFSKFLAGDGVQGDQFHIKNLGATGWYYQFCINGQQGGHGCGNAPI